MGVYDEEIEMATEMIEEFGQLVTWSQLTNGTPDDSDKPWKPGDNDTVDYLVSIAFFPVDKQTQYFIQYMTGTEIPTGTLIGYMAQVPLTPAIKDVVTRGGVQLTVDKFDVIDPNGEGTVLYILEFGS